MEVPIQPSESHVYLQYLRELFRERMREEDFCIGGKQVEKLFRELLGEPEPVPPVYSINPNTPHMSATDISELFESIIQAKIAGLFDVDSAFYGRIKK